MSQKRHIGPSLLAYLGFLLLLMTAGCSEELGPKRFPTARVSGTVTEGGRPLTRGWIEFIPVEGAVGNLRSGWIQPDGSFRVDGVAIGENAIRLVYAGIQIRGGDQLFGQFATPVRRVIPAQPACPLKIDVLEEAVRFQTARPRLGESISRASFRRRAMSPPARLTEPPPVAAPGAQIHIIYRDGAGEIHLDWTTTRLEDAIHDHGGTLWVDIENPDGASTDAVEALLRNLFGFHPLAIEDAIQDTHVPKVDDWGDYLYLVFHGTSIDPQTDELRLHELDVFLGSNYLVTYHTEPLSFLDQDRKSIERDPRDRLQNGCDHLLVRFLERAVDQSLEAIEYLDDRVDEIQNQVIENPRAKSLQTIFRVKRSAIRLHKIFGPQREVLNRMARDPYKPIQAEHRVYFRDVYDHVVRIHDISESLRDLIAGTLETYLSVMSNRTNDIMKTLTLVTVMFMPMSFLVGFFGMNFFGETLAFQSPLPKRLLFFGSLLIMCISPSLMWNYARRKKWF